MMLIWLAGAVATVIGIVVGYLLRGASAKAESAKFEALATEREKRVGELAGEVDALRSGLAMKTDESSRAAVTIAELNAKLASEEKNLAEKLALLETAKKALTDQFQALAADILDQKSK